MNQARASSHRPAVGIGTVVFKADRVLLVKRARPPAAGSWSLPGGRQQWGETTRAAALREVREETGVEAEILELLDVVDFIERGADGAVATHFTLVDYLARWRIGRPAAASDAAEAVWAGLGELGRFGLWEETRRIIALGARRLERYG